MMSTRMWRAVALAMRSAVCCHTHGSRACVLRGALLAPEGPSGPRGGLIVPQRRAYSSLDNALSLGPCSGRPPPPPPPRTTPMQTPQPLRASRLHIGDPALARLVAQQLGPWDVDDAKTAILECNPGPGVLTETLLNAGARRLVALEGDKFYLPRLRELEGRHDGRLEVVHCDYFKLDPVGGGGCPKPPALTADKLFADLGISEADWTDDSPVKVVGILPPARARERAALLKTVYSLFERVSVYRYGRMELFLFMSESEYLKMTRRPGDMYHYRAFGVLCQMAWHVRLLHKEPRESFGGPPSAQSSSSLKKGKKGKLPNDHLCLVHLRPRADLFSSGLTPSNASSLLVMVKQCLVKRKARLVHSLNQWSPPDGGGKLLSEMGMQDDILTGHVYADEYRRLFELMEKSPEFKDSWLHEEVLENAEITEKVLGISSGRHKRP